MRRKSSLPLPRYVDQASVQVGDTIRVSWHVGDVEVSRAGTVWRIYTANGIKQFLTADGNEIAQFNRHNPGRKLRFTLLAEAKVNTDTPLFELEGVT